MTAISECRLKQLIGDKSGSEASGKTQITDTFVFNLKNHFASLATLISYLNVKQNMNRLNYLVAECFRISKMQYFITCKEEMQNSLILMVFKV